MRAKLNNYLQKLEKSKKGISENYITAIIIGLVLVVVLFLVLADLVPQAQTAGDTLNASGVPLGSLFASNGVIFVVIMAGVLIVVIYAFLKFKKRR